LSESEVGLLWARRCFGLEASSAVPARKEEGDEKEEEEGEEEKPGEVETEAKCWDG
jgi:hypothetical protein